MISLGGANLLTGVVWVLAESCESLESSPSSSELSLSSSPVQVSIVSDGVSDESGESCGVSLIMSGGICGTWVGSYVSP